MLTLDLRHSLHKEHLQMHWNGQSLISLNLFQLQCWLGPVTSNSSGAMRHEAAVIGTTSTTACIHITCGFVEQFGSTWLSSVTRSSTGIYVLNFPAGTWSATPMCTCSGGGVTASLSCRSRYALAGEDLLTSLEIRMTSDSGSLQDEMVNLSCTGKR